MSWFDCSATLETTLPCKTSRFRTMDFFHQTLHVFRADLKPIRVHTTKLITPSQICANFRDRHAYLHHRNNRYWISQSDITSVPVFLPCIVIAGSSAMHHLNRVPDNELPMVLSIIIRFWVATSKYFALNAPINNQQTSCCSCYFTGENKQSQIIIWPKKCLQKISMELLFSHL